MIKDIIRDKRHALKIYLFFLFVIVNNSCKITNYKNDRIEDVSEFRTQNFKNTGKYDLTKSGIFGRHPIKRPVKDKELFSINGRMVFKICIDSDGNTVFVKALQQGTTIKNNKVLESGIRYLSKFKWQKIEEKNIEQCGKYSLVTER